MNKKLNTFIASATLLALPIFAFAYIAPVIPTQSADADTSRLITVLLDFIWPLFMGFAVIMFLVAGFQFLTAQGDPTKVDAARQSILWGVVGVAMGVFAFSLPFIVQTAIGNI